MSLSQSVPVTVTKAEVGAFLRRVKGIARVSAWALITLTVVFSAATVAVSRSYAVPVSEAASSVLRQGQLAIIAFVIHIFDPCATRLASVGPSGVCHAQRAESVLPPGKSLVVDSGTQILAEEIHNQRIVYGQGQAFRYQPYDEPRLVELRKKYHLDEVIAGASSEFEEMVRLRSWARSQFRRQDYQPEDPNFDALAILDRGYRDHGRSLSSGRFLDPCHFFPLLYAQVMLSMGHQPRLMSTDHGVTEIWSNQFGKWIMMDAELDLHLEKDGVPLNVWDLFCESCDKGPGRARIVRGTQTSGDANTTMVHLKAQDVPVAEMVSWYHTNFELTDLRNDWMTNHYFRGHPARNERNSLVYVDRDNGLPIKFARRLRPTTSEKEDMYWSLNQAEVLMGSPVRDSLDLIFRTVTPNFKCFELTVDGSQTSKCDDSNYRWELHEGINTLEVRPLNQFDVRGIESSLRIRVLRNNSSAITN